MAVRRARTLVVDVGLIRTADLETVDALARLALRCRRHGCGLRVTGATRELLDLLELAGLSDALSRDVLRVEAPSGVEVRREPEQLEQPGAEEDGDLADPVA